MQTTFPQLVRQQIILKGLGYYKGPIDGLWGPMTIEAKKRFESELTFLPGLPNNGLPFAGVKPWPLGITLDVKTGLLVHPCVEQLAHEEEEALKVGPPGRAKPSTGKKKSSAPVAPPEASSESS